MRFCFVALLLGSITSSSSRADCGEPTPQLVWSFPADGDVDVPTNSDVFLLGDGIAGVTLDGLVLPVANGLGALLGDPGDLGADSDHELVVSFVFDVAADLQPAPVVIAFRTGGALAAPPVTPTVERIVALTPRDLDPLCRAVVNVGKCYDGPQDTDVVLETGDAFAFAVRGPLTGLFWPGECGDPQVFLRPLFVGDCFSVMAIAQDGTSTAAAERCVDGKAKGVRVKAKRARVKAKAKRVKAKETVTTAATTTAAPPRRSPSASRCWSCRCGVVAAADRRPRDRHLAIDVGPR